MGTKGAELHEIIAKYAPSTPQESMIKLISIIIMIGAIGFGVTLYTSLMKGVK